MLDECIVDFNVVLFCLLKLLLQLNYLMNAKAKPVMGLQLSIELDILVESH